MSSCESKGLWQGALALLADMTDCGLQPDVISFDTAMSACDKAEQWQPAIELLMKLREASVKEDPVTCSALVSACVKGEEWALALWFIAHMNLERDVFIYTGAMSAYEKSNHWHGALLVFDDLLCSLLEVDLVARNAIIGACTEAWQIALALFSKANCDEISFNALLGACSKGEKTRQSSNECAKPRKWDVRLLAVNQLSRLYFQLRLRSFNRIRRTIVITVWISTLGVLVWVVHVWSTMQHCWQVCPVFLSTKRCLNSTPLCQLQHDPMMPDPMKRCHDFHVRPVVLSRVWFGVGLQISCGFFQSIHYCVFPFPETSKWSTKRFSHLMPSSLDRRIQSSMSSCRSNVAWWSVPIQAGPNCDGGWSLVIPNPSVIRFCAFKMEGLGKSYFIFRHTQFCLETCCSCTLFRPSKERWSRTFAGSGNHLALGHFAFERVETGVLNEIENCKQMQHAA